MTRRSRSGVEEEEGPGRAVDEAEELLKGVSMARQSEGPAVVVAELLSRSLKELR